jgi:site-specific DNA-methyltransferase (adenine-specific)
MKSVQIGDCTLYLGDCLEILPTLGKVDAVVTDPPYEKEAHRVGRRTHKSIKSGVNVDLSFDAITETQRIDIACSTTDICEGWSIFFCQAEAVTPWRDALEKASAKYKRTMVWIKPDSAPQFNGMMPAPGYESMPLAWCGHGKPHWNGGGKRGVFTHLTNQSDRHGVHQTEKPVSLMVELVGLFTNRDNIVADPFMGSGTTGVACVKLGRKFIGIEIEPKYFDIACKRIQKAYDEPCLPLAEPKPKQEKMAL